MIPESTFYEMSSRKGRGAIEMDEATLVLNIILYVLLPL